MIIALLGNPRRWKSFRSLPGASTMGICRLGGPDSIRPDVGLVFDRRVRERRVKDRRVRALNPKREELCETVQVEGKTGGLASQPSVF